MEISPLVIQPPDLSELGVPMYANVVHVSSTPHDFKLTFSFLASPIDQPDAATPAVPKAVGEVVLPASAVDALLDVIKVEKGRFAERYGSPRPVLQEAARRSA
jgi:hypothetical protein